MQYHRLPDSELYSLLRDNDSGAFKEIYLRFWKELFIHACRKIADQDVAKELVQNIFLKLWEKRSLTNVDNLRFYLFASLRYNIIGIYKTQLVHQRFLSRFFFEAESRSPEQDLNAAELQRDLELGISMLPAKTKRIFELSRVDFLTAREIAEILHISEKAVEYHICRSIKILRVHLKEHLLILILAWSFYF